MSNDNARFEMRGAVAVVTIDDGKANALSPTLITNMNAALERAQEQAKAVALFGRPGRFSAGFDLRVMMSGPEPARKLVLQGCEALMRLYEFPLPVVMGCTGHAIAAGILLAATGDVRIGARGPFKIGLNEVANSMPVPIFAHELARDRLDPRELVPATMHAKIYDPEGAQAAGWLDEVVAPEDLEARVLSEAERLSKLSGTAYARTKRSLRRRTLDHVRATLEANLQEFTVG